MTIIITTTTTTQRNTKGTKQHLGDGKVGDGVPEGHQRVPKRLLHQEGDLGAKDGPALSQHQPGQDLLRQLR